METKTSDFVPKNHILRQIWTDTDCLMLIFAGASAEFCLNPAVDWLFFTNKLPSHPIDRMFSTINYARKIMFSEESQAIHIIQNINQIHGNIEFLRKNKIGNVAYLGVIYMLINYSIVAFEILKRPLSEFEKESIYQAFKKIAFYMHISQMPTNYTQYQVAYFAYEKNYLIKNEFTSKLKKAYRKSLGLIKYSLLKTVQSAIISKEIALKTKIRKSYLPILLLKIYSKCLPLSIRLYLLRLLLPIKYHKELSVFN